MADRAHQARPEPGRGSQWPAEYLAAYARVHQRPAEIARGRQGPAGPSEPVGVCQSAPEPGSVHQSAVEVVRGHQGAAGLTARDS